MRSTVGIPLLPAQAVAEGQGGGGCQSGTVNTPSSRVYAQVAFYLIAARA